MAATQELAPRETLQSSSALDDIRNRVSPERTEAKNTAVQRTKDILLAKGLEEEVELFDPVNNVFFTAKRRRTPPVHVEGLGPGVQLELKEYFHVVSQHRQLQERVVVEIVTPDPNDIANGKALFTLGDRMAYAATFRRGDIETEREVILREDSFIDDWEGNRANLSRIGVLVGYLSQIDTALITQSGRESQAVVFPSSGDIPPQV